MEKKILLISSMVLIISLSFGCANYSLKDKTIQPGETRALNANLPFGVAYYKFVPKSNNHAVFYVFTKEGKELGALYVNPSSWSLGQKRLK